MYRLKMFLFRRANKIRFYKQHKAAIKDNKPKGPYCYDNDKTCPYFRRLNCKKKIEFRAWCVYCNDNDMWTLWDMCKMCKENEDDN